MGQYEARVRELIERRILYFLMMIETMLDVRRAIFEGYASCIGCFCRWFSTIRSAGV